MLLACVPNVSEGRDHNHVEKLAEAFGAHRRVKLLQVHSDPDHNRSVLTAVGLREDLVHAAFALICTACKLLDLRAHRGQHPRLGVVDVCPFIPLLDTPMEEAVLSAKELADRVAKELALPVFLYGEAAEKPQRRELSYFRRQDFEEVRRLVSEDPAWQPDRGPRELHDRFGAVAVGARPPLVAFNVDLATPNVEIAREIAGKIRHKAGGFPGVQALGFSLSSQNLSQVSCNLVQDIPTTPARVYHAVTHLAQQAGTKVVRSELVGLMPRAVAYRSLKEALAMSSFSGRQILEDRVSDYMPLLGFLQEVAAPDSGLGGGAVATVVASMAAALGAFVASFCRRAPHQVRDSLQKKAVTLHLLGQQDAEAYARFAEAKRAGQDMLAQKRGLKEACDVPLEALGQIAEVLESLRSLTPKGAIATDLRLAAHLLLAAARGLGDTLKANIRAQCARDFSRQYRRKAEELLAQCQQHVAAVLGAEPTS